MAKALETVFADFKPSPLQQVAIDRIEYFQRKLKEDYGLYMRSSMELEFMVEDGNGHPTRAVVNLKQAQRFLKEHEGLPYIEKVVTENDLAPELYQLSGHTSAYEVNIADHFDKDKWAESQVELFSPALIAGTVEKLKQTSLEKMLLASSCLNKGISPLRYRPNFMARPYHDKKIEEVSPHATSGLHVNVSLYDSAGYNLFAHCPDLLVHCAHSLIAMQNDAALSMLPNPNSLQRIDTKHVNAWAPHGIGVMDKKDPANAYNSVGMGNRLKREFDVKADDDFTRLENRLPGADADPFVAMAVTMAALYDAVRKHVRKVENEADAERMVPLFEWKKIYVDNAPGIPYAQYPLPRAHGELSAKFSSAHHMRDKEMLGPALYDEILKEYGEIASPGI